MSSGGYLLPKPDYYSPYQSRLRQNSVHQVRGHTQQSYGAVPRLSWRNGTERAHQR